MRRTCEYRLYEHPLLPPRLVKRGYCWPALILGPPWLLFRRLWIPTAVLLATAAIAYHLNHHNLTEEMVLNACAYMENHGVWVSIAGSGLTDMDCVTRTEHIDWAILILAQAVPPWVVNSLWERDLVNRGYTLSRSLHARSHDEACAILSRMDG